MQSIKPPETIKFYQLIKMSVKPSLSLSPAGTSTGTYVGQGFYRTIEEAEFNRTMEALKDTEDNSYHIFELEFPNPIL
jgi:hypothetical protein